jgi:hypothetical protein
MALRVDPFQNRHQSVGCPVVLPLQVHAKVGQYGAGRPAETRNVGARLGGPELPCCYTKTIGIILCFRRARVNLAFPWPTVILQQRTR